MSFMKEYPKQYEHMTKCSALNSLHGCQMSSLCAMSWSVPASDICKICPWSSMSFSTAGWSHHLCGHLPGQLHEPHHLHQRLPSSSSNPCPCTPPYPSTKSCADSSSDPYSCTCTGIPTASEPCSRMSTNACMQAISKCLSTGEPSTDACTDSSPDPM